MVTNIILAAPEQPPESTGRPSTQAVTRRGRLVLAHYDPDQLELETVNGRVELLGPHGTEVHEGDEVEVVGLPDPTSRRSEGLPALLILQLRRLS